MSEKTRLYKTDGSIKKKAFVQRKPDKGKRKSKGLPVENILRLQQTLGNRGVQRLIKPGTDKPVVQRQEEEKKEDVQTKLLQRQEEEQKEDVQAQLLQRQEEGGEEEKEEPA
jgi:hypothetical protein